MESLFSNYSRLPTSPVPSTSLTHSSSPYNNNTSSQRITQTRLVLCNTPHVASSTFANYSCAAPKHAPVCAFNVDHEDGDGDGDDDLALIVAVKSVASHSSSYSSLSSTSASSDLHTNMPIRNKAKRQARDPISPSSTPYNTPGHGRPTTPSSPVQIPPRSVRNSNRHIKTDTVHHRRRSKYNHSLNFISPSVAALLAITDIPRPPRKRHSAERTITVDEAVSDQHVSEKSLSLSLIRSPLDLLLSPPEDLADDDLSAVESNVGSFLTRTISVDSVPSLGGESFATEDFNSSIETPRSINMSARRRHSPMRKSLEPIRSPPDATEEHPLAVADDLYREAIGLLPAQESEKSSVPYPLLQPFKPLRSAFKSNLTASLRALRSAAKSFSSFNFPSIPADDFLTRSILTIDPKVPYTDERRPPVTEEMPSAELRRYLNPTTSSHLNSQPKARSTGVFSASIQMQTYKVQRSRSAPPPSPRIPCVTGNPLSSASASIANTSGNSPQPATKTGHQIALAPGMRQREMRENPDFIRIAVMEMAMRRRGKLDNQKPGRARWALPPRRPSTKPYSVGPNGVPTRWIPATY